MELNFSKSMVVTIKRVHNGEVAGRFTTTGENGTQNRLTQNRLTRFTQSLMWALNESQLWLYAGHTVDKPLTSVVPVFGAMNPRMCGNGMGESRLRFVTDAMRAMAKRGWRLFLTPRFGDRNSTLELFADETDVPADAPEDVIENNEVLNAREASMDAAVRAEF